MNKRPSGGRARYLSLQLPLFLAAKVSEDFEAGTPAFQLHLPVQHHTSGDDDEVRTPVSWRDQVQACQSGPGHIHSLETHTHTHTQDSAPHGESALPFSQARWASRAMVWMVLPRPISSARMPLSFFSYMVTSQSSPMCWYSRNVPCSRKGIGVLTC